MNRTLCYSLIASALLLSACASQQQQKKTTKAPAAQPAAEQPVYTEPAAPAYTEPARVSYTGDCMPQPSGVPSGYNWNGAALPTGDPATSVISLEKMVQDPVVVGQEFDYQIRVGNISNCLTLDDVIVTDGTLNGPWQFISADPPGNQADGKMTWNLGKLAQGETRTINVRGKATGDGNMFGCASVVWTPIVCIDTNAVTAALALEKSTPAKVSICDDIPITLVVRNTGSGTATGVRVTDELPSGWTAADGSATLSWDIGSLGGGESRELTAMARSSRTGSFTNNASASADGNLSATASSSTSVHKPVFQITKTGREEQVMAKQVHYTLALKNTGDWPAANTSIEDTVTGADAITAASDGGAVSGNRVVWNLGTMEPGAERTVTVTVRRDSEGRTSNVATARGECADDVTANAATTYKGIPAVLLEVIDTVDPVEIGGQTVYVITVTNQGSAADNDIEIVCEAENTAKLISAGGATTGNISGQKVTFTPLPSLGAGEVAEWRVTVEASTEGDTRFTVILNTRETDREIRETEATRMYE